MQQSPPTESIEPIEPAEPSESIGAIELTESAAPAGHFYKIDSTRVTPGEYWSEMHSPLFLVAMLIKWLRVRTPCSTDDMPVHSLEPFEVLEDQFPADVAEQMQPMLDSLRDAGFGEAIYHIVDISHDRTTNYRVTMRDQAGRCFACVHLRQWRLPNPPRVKLFAQFVTPMSDGTWVWSLSGNPDMLAPPNCVVNRLPKATVDELFASHQQAVTQRRPAAAQPIATVDDMVDAMERHHAAVRDFHIKRGVFAELSDDERQQNAQVEETRRDMLAHDVEHAEVLAELQRLQHKKPKAGAAGTLLLLGISLAIFVAAGFAAWSMDLLIILVVGLLIHELGHYIAMRMFRYRNVKMFFIPLVGAAVSGQSYNVPGWKKAIVSLMGPVPSIVLALGVGIVGMVLSSDMLLNAAMMLLVLNGLNLLPILPLDGGWLMHTLLFCRHYVLDVIFRIAAVAMLLGSSWLLGGDVLLMGLGVLMALTIPLSIKLGRVTHGLRREGIGTASPDAQSIPTEVAQRIVAKLKLALPKANNRQVAQNTMSVFESLNARPPGALVSAALLVVMVGSIAVAAVGAAVFTYAQQRDWGIEAWEPPKLDPQAILTTRGPQAMDFAADRHTLVAMHESETEAQQTYDEVVAELPPTAAVTLFGQAILLTLPAEGDPVAAAQWQERLESSVVFVYGDMDGDRTAVSLTCTAPDEVAAASVEAQVNAYLASAAEGGAAPWQPVEAGRSDADVKRWSAKTGQIFHLGENTRTFYIDFAHMDEGAAAMVAWLHARGFRDFSYGFVPAIWFTVTELE